MIIMQIYELVQFLSQVKAPLINCIWPLRDLKRSGARRASPAMAVALGKKCNAATVRFRARPSGPTGCSALRVASFRQADACLQNGALIAKQPVGQRPYAINQRCLYSTIQVYPLLSNSCNEMPFFLTSAACFWESST